MLKKPKFKICKRLGPGVYDKCQTPKFAAASATLSRGRGKKGGRKSVTEYGAQLAEKQKIRFSYGISERQLSNYVRKASLAKNSIADRFFEVLETRLDNVIYRMGIAPSRRSARQFVSHGHFLVNGKRSTVPSQVVYPGDVITIREGSKSKAIFGDLAVKLKEFAYPDWLIFDPDKMEGKVTGAPKNTETFLDLNAVLEFYSR